ncbi:MAG: hypothetical protein AB1813_08410 [Verrucomicrobiota bacterium]
MKQNLATCCRPPQKVASFISAVRTCIVGLPGLNSVTEGIVWHAPLPLAVDFVSMPSWELRIKVQPPGTILLAGSGHRT